VVNLANCAAIINDQFSIQINSTRRFSDLPAYVRAAYARVCAFFDELKAIAPHLTPLQCWYRMLSEAMKKYLQGALLKLSDLINSEC
jgi:hypothetical protein